MVTMAVSLKRKMRSQTDSFIEGYCVAIMREEIMKMKRGFVKRSIGAALILAMTTSLFTGCGNKKDGSNDIVSQVSQGSKDYVFAQEIIDVGSRDNSLSRIVYNGERVFTSSYMSDGGTEISTQFIMFITGHITMTMRWLLMTRLRKMLLQRQAKELLLKLQPKLQQIQPLMLHQKRAVLLMKQRMLLQKRLLRHPRMMSAIW